MLKTRTKGARGMLRRILLGCGIASSVLYIAADILGTLRYPGYRYTEQQFSELTAAGSPVRHLMIGLGVIPYTLLLAAGERGLRNAMHVPLTAVMSLFVLLAVGFGATLLGERFRYYSHATMAILIVFGVLTNLQAGKMVADEPTPWMGLTERINIYATMLWVAVLAIGHLRAQKPR